MVDSATKLPIKTDANSVSPATTPAKWLPFDDLRLEINRVFEDFGRNSWLRPFNLDPGLLRHWNTPAIDVVEGDAAYELSAELPGLDGKDVEVTVHNGSITLKGEKREDREEKSKGYHLKERRFGSFERSLPVPQGVDGSRIEASFKNGVLKVTMPKTPEAQKPEKKIAIRAA